MSQYELIKTAHRVYGKSIRAITREFGHSRNTIRKALREVAPAYQRTKEPACPVMGDYEAVILDWLRADLQMPKKQRHTARRIYTRLVEEYDFSGAESTVRRFVRMLKAREGLGKQEAFIPLDTEAGREGEIDWGEALAKIGGQRQTVHLFCMCSKFSGKDFVRAYPNSRQEMFFDGHIHGFYYYGGVFPTLVYDNLSSAVLRVFKGKKRVEQEAFRKFRGYYTFEARFCNPGKGHEKGGVEGLVGYARRNYLVPLPEVDSMTELNELLLSRCIAGSRRRIAGKDDTIEALFESERDLLLKMPAQDYPVIRPIVTKADHYSTVRIDQNRYSVPTDYCRMKVDVALCVDKVSIHHNHRLIAEHARTFGKNKWLLDPFHYLKLLCRKPGAFDDARPIRQWRGDWPVSYERLLAHFRGKNGQGRGTKEFIKVLLLLKEYSQHELNSSIEQAIQLSLSDAASVKVLLDHQRSEPQQLELLSMDEHPHLDRYKVASVALESYASLLSSEGGGL